MVLRQNNSSRTAFGLSLSLAAFGAGIGLLRADMTNPIPVLRIDAAQVVAKVSPLLYGLMTEEINYSYEGGLYGELLRNRTFKADPAQPAFWSAFGSGKISLDTNQPLNAALGASLKLEAGPEANGMAAGIANGGYWGIPVGSKSVYHASFYARVAAGFDGELNVMILSYDGKQVFATSQVSRVAGDWRKYEVALKLKNTKPSKNNRFVITTTHPGTIWFSQVSLFPPTYHNRPNGNRPDLMRLLADMKPQFLRFPGGNYLEGNTIENRFDWKKTVGDISQRPGHRNDGWGYWSTDGLGLLEFLEWCEDLEMQPLLAVYAGYSMHQEHVAPGPALQPYVQDALDEIEYVSGDANSKWGAQRARDGHPAPFPLNYVEVGNEDWFDRSGSYDGRFAAFYDAIKARYHHLQIIATTPTTNRQPDLIDEHYYRGSEWEMESHAQDYDHRPRSGPQVFVGEWATRVGVPTPNMAGALGDAAWMIGMERNSDLVRLSCYAPLFVNVSDLTPGSGSMQWRSDLIGYDALTSYGSPSYYVQKLFSTHHGDNVLTTEGQGIPTRTWSPPAKRQDGAEPPPPRQVPSLFFDATRDSRSGVIYLKVVNSLEIPQPVRVRLAGVLSSRTKVRAIVLKASRPEDTNSLEEPMKIAPITEKPKRLGTDFTRTFPACSITVLEMTAK